VPCSLAALASRGSPDRAARGGRVGCARQSNVAVGQENDMLRVYEQYLALVRQLPPVLVVIERRDVDLGRQLRRAVTSVALNMSEGSGNEGGTRRQRFLSSLGSLRESIAGLEVAEALGYVVLPHGLLAQLGQVVGVLVVLVHGRR
jgi:four helix bundle protein